MSDATPSSQRRPLQSTESDEVNAAPTDSGTTKPQTVVTSVSGRGDPPDGGGPPPPASGGGDGRGFGAGVLGSAPLILSVAAIATVVVYLLPVDADKYEWWSTWANFIAPAAGILVGAAVGIALAIWGKDRSSSDRANPAIHGELTRYWATLNSRVAAVCELPDGTPRDFSKVTDDLRACGTIADDQRACDTARMLRDSIGRELGLWPLESPTAPGKGARWVLGTGYVDLWTSLHDADEALFIVEPDAAVRGYGLHDEMRLKDSNVRNEDDFLSKLRRAVLVLGGGQYLSAAPPCPQWKTTRSRTRASGGSRG